MMTSMELQITSTFSATGISNFCTNFASQAFYCAIFGVTSGAWVCLSPVILTDLFGLNKLTCALGLFSLCEGIGSTLGPPTVGKFSIC